MPPVDPPAVGTCEPWATEADLCEPCNVYDAELGDMALNLQMASDVLNNLSPTKYPGVCTDVVRPCAKPSGDIFNRGDPLLLLRHMPGTWFPLWGTCGCWTSGRCGLGGNREVALPKGPVVEVTEVLVDGQALGADEYRLDDQRRLVRRPDADGRPQAWPCCQRMDLDDTDVGTWSVAYTYGVRPPPLGVRAAAVLACELALACSPSVGDQGKCRLPRRVTSVVRQGVTIIMAPSDFLDPKTGKTGIWEVDLFLFGERAEQSHGGATVFSPDTYPTVRRAGT